MYYIKMSERLFLILSHGIFPSKEKRKGGFIYGDEGYRTVNNVMKKIPDNVELYLLTEYGCKALVSKKLDYSIKSSLEMYRLDLLHNTEFQNTLGYKFLESCKLYNPGDNYVDVMISLEDDPETWNIWRLGRNGYTEFGNNRQRPSRPDRYNESGDNKPLSTFLESLGGTKNIVIVQCCMPYITPEYGWNRNELNIISRQIRKMEALGKKNLLSIQYNKPVGKHTRLKTRQRKVQPYGHMHPEDNDQVERDTDLWKFHASDIGKRKIILNKFKQTNKSCKKNNSSNDCLKSTIKYISSFFAEPKKHAEGKKKKTMKKKK